MGLMPDHRGCALFTLMYIQDMAQSMAATPRSGRRGFLKSLCVISGTASVAGCLGGGDDGSDTTATETSAGNMQLRTELGLEYPDYELEEELEILQWTDYWHPNTVPDFEDAYDISVTVTSFGSNEEMYEILKAEGFDSYDLAFPSDWMVSKLLREERLRALDISKLRNWEHLGERWIEDAPYDSGSERYSAPYLWGTTGIAWHEAMVDDSLDDVDALDSWDAMWDEAYAGQIQMMDLPRETYTAALKRLGYSLNTTDPEKIQEATELLVQQKELVTEYTGVKLIDDLVNKRATPLHTFSGSALTAQTKLREDGESPVAYRIPREGGVVWIDTMVVPDGAPHANAAHAFIDYILNPTVGAMNANFNLYATPNEAAKQNVPSEHLSNPAIYPPPATIEKLEFIDDVGDALTHYEDGWETVQNA